MRMLVFQTVPRKMIEFVVPVNFPQTTGWPSATTRKNGSKTSKFPVFPSSAVCTPSHKKGFPLSSNKHANWSKSTQQKQAGRQMLDTSWKIEIIGLCNLLFSQDEFFFFLEQNTLERHTGIRNSALNPSCLFRTMPSKGPVLSHLFSFLFISGELLQSIWVSLYPIFQFWCHYTACSLLLSLHLLRFRPEYSVLVAGLKLQVSGSSPVEP